MLRQQLANRTGVSKQEAERFLDGMIDATIQALQDERQIKINNLGQFRLQTVAPRRSVNVATGEHIQLEEHNKITFTPEISLKEELIYLNIFNKILKIIIKIFLIKNQM